MTQVIMGDGTGFRPSMRNPPAKRIIRPGGRSGFAGRRPENGLRPLGTESLGIGGRGDLDGGLAGHAGRLLARVGICGDEQAEQGKDADKFDHGEF